MGDSIMAFKLLSIPLTSFDSMHHMGHMINCSANPDYVPWIWNTFQECVTNTIQYVGFILGLIQLLCWILVFLPQFYENYKQGKMDEAIAPAFLILWMCGDMSNLTGCILTHQLATQFATAIYYLLMDVIIISQFVYYYFKNKRRTVTIRDSHQENPAIQNGQSHVIYCCTFLLSTAFLVSLPWQQGQASSDHIRPYAAGRSLLSYDNGSDPDCVQYYKNTGDCVFYDAKDIFGYVCGCFSGIFYVGSRVPQLIKNYQRKSVEGVSVLMFILTVAGNVFYGMSVLMESTSMVFIIRHMPWLVGSLGTLVFDCIMLCQFARYQYCRPKTVDVEEDRRRLLNGSM